MKKLLIGLFIFGFFAMGSQVHASTLSDALLKIENLTKEISQLKAKLGASAYSGLSPNPYYTDYYTLPSTNNGCPSGQVYSSITGQKCPSTVALITPTTDLTPRISYWLGKVNQHVSVSEGMWQTDSDGVSGAGIDKLTYCKKWYPNTTSVIEYKNETINSWHDAGNVNDYPSTKMSYKCVQGGIDHPVSVDFKINGSHNPSPVTLGSKLTVSWVAEKGGEPVICYPFGYNVGGWVDWATIGPLEATGTKYLEAKIYNFTNDYSDYSTPFKIGIDCNGVEDYIMLTIINSSTPSITVLSPNGGEVYKVGDKIAIKWKAESLNDFAIELVNNKTSQSWTIFSFFNGVPGEGYSWKVGQVWDNNELINVLPGEYYVNIWAMNGSKAIYDRSDNYFTINSSADNGCSNSEVYSSTTGQKCPSITPSITVLSPNGGEVYQAGQQITVKWKTENIPANSLINISVENSSDHSAIQLTPNYTINDGVESVILPSAIASSWLSIIYGKNFKINVHAVNIGNNVLDMSDNTFTINSSADNGCLNSEGYSSTTGQKCPSIIPSVTVLSPNGGEVYREGETIRVKWTSSNLPASYRIHLVFNYLDELKDEYKQSVLIRETEDKGYYDYKLPMFSQYKSSNYPLPGKYYEFTVYLFDSIYSVNSALTADSSDNFFTITTDNGCSSGQVYSSTTGQKCDLNIISIYPAGCTSNLGYSPTTGRCIETHEERDTGCIAGQNYSSTTGKPCALGLYTKENTDTTTTTQEITTPIRRTLKLGIKGDDVKTLQEFLNLLADGSFGPQTQAKVIEWQAMNGLTPDGAFGYYSRQKAGLE